MLTITAEQFAALSQASEQGFVAQVADDLASRGHPRPDADAAAHRAWTEGRARGLSSEDEIATFARVLAAGRGEEPGWSREIVDGGAPRKAERLERCLHLATGGRG